MQIVLDDTVSAVSIVLVIFAKVRLGVTPDINAIATIIIVLVAAGVATAAVITGRRDRTEAQLAGTGTRHG
jgi:putrescine transport system permease protein